MSSLHYDSNDRYDGTFKRTDPMATDILYEQQILNGSTFYTLHKHTDPAECWKRLARCFYLHRQKDPSIRGIKVLTSPNLVVIYVLYASGWRDLFQVPFECLNEKTDL